MFDNKDFDLEKENISSEASDVEAASSPNDDAEAVSSQNDGEEIASSPNDDAEVDSSNDEPSEDGDLSRLLNVSDAYQIFPHDEEDYGEEFEVPAVKKGKGGFWIVAMVMFVVSLAVMSYFSKMYGRENGGNAGGGNSNLPSHEYTSTVVEHIKTEAPRGELYTDKTQLYNDAQKSCVTVVCTTKSNFFGQAVESASLGSGFVISKEGYIATNAHVVDGGSSYKVRFYNGKEYEALLVGKDVTCDIAVLKIHGSEDLVPVSFGDSENVRVGEFAMAIGTPSDVEFFGTMTFGVISGKERKVSITNSAGQTVKTMLLLQTDATLNPGNSGGPLFNMYGQVIGINTMKLSNNYEGMGFSIPSSGAVKIINSLISLGEADYTDSEYVKGGAHIGIKGITLDKKAKKDYNFSEDTPDGALVLSIEKKSSSYKAGLSVYDVICEFNGEQITSMEQLISKIQDCYPGDEVSVKVYRIERNGKEGKYYTYTFPLDAIEE